MKKLILISMFVILSGLMVAGQNYNDQYYDYGDRDSGYTDYDSPVSNQEYYYDYESILPMIGRYSTIYYWEHPYKYINFVILGDRVYIIPREIFFRFYRRGPFIHVSVDRFVALSCFGMSYYDNYYRFSLYSDYYRYNYHRGRSYGSSWFRGLRDHYRRYYRNRRNSTRYTDLRRRHISSRSLSRNHGSDYRHSGYRTVYQNRRYDSRGVYGKTTYSGNKRSGYTGYRTTRRATGKFTTGSSQRRGERVSGGPVKSTGVVRGLSGKNSGSSGSRTVRKKSSSGKTSSKRGISGTRSSGKRSHKRK